MRKSKRVLKLKEMVLEEKESEYCMQESFSFSRKQKGISHYFPTIKIYFSKISLLRNRSIYDVC